MEWSNSLQHKQQQGQFPSSQTPGAIFHPLQILGKVVMNDICIASYMDITICDGRNISIQLFGNDTCRIAENDTRFCIGKPLVVILPLEL